MAEPTTTPATVGDVDELAALIRAGRFWRFVPEWAPRTGYAEPTPDILRAVEVGLLRRVPG
ncbi:hypothetical protein ACIHCQ_08885 [Streptomyces sp. NPDC052236]|uniref:hypothetical protein n=1 Tax=Streptomyces sp. NPDC052236 TaxID=3365686 RepID=UPI0037D711C3